MVGLKEPQCQGMSCVCVIKGMYSNARSRVWVYGQYSGEFLRGS